MDARLSPSVRVQSVSVVEFLLPRKQEPPVGAGRGGSSEGNQAQEVAEHCRRVRARGCNQSGPGTMAREPQAVK